MYAVGGSGTVTADNLDGRPTVHEQYPNGGASPDAFTPAIPDDPNNFITVRAEFPHTVGDDAGNNLPNGVYISRLEIWESDHPGAVVKIEQSAPPSGRSTVLWEADRRCANDVLAFCYTKASVAVGTPERCPVADSTDPTDCEYDAIYGGGGNEGEECGSDILTTVGPAPGDPIPDGTCVYRVLIPPGSSLYDSNQVELTTSARIFSPPLTPDRDAYLPTGGALTLTLDTNQVPGSNQIDAIAIHGDDATTGLPIVDYGPGCSSQADTDCWLECKVSLMATPWEAEAAWDVLNDAAAWLSAALAVDASAFPRQPLRKGRDELVENAADPEDFGDVTCAGVTLPPTLASTGMAGNQLLLVPTLRPAAAPVSAVPCAPYDGVLGPSGSPGDPDPASWTRPQIVHVNMVPGFASKALKHDKEEGAGRLRRAAGDALVQAVLGALGWGWDDASVAARDRRLRAVHGDESMQVRNLCDPSQPEACTVCPDPNPPLYETGTTAYSTDTDADGSPDLVPCTDCSGPSSCGSDWDSRYLRFSTTPAMVREARNHFNAPSLRLVEMESSVADGRFPDVDGVRTLSPAPASGCRFDGADPSEWYPPAWCVEGARLEHRLHLGDLMTTSLYVDLATMDANGDWSFPTGLEVVGLSRTRLAVALLADLGWFEMVEGAFESNPYGRGLGPSFVADSCALWTEGDAGSSSGALRYLCPRTTGGNLQFPAAPAADDLRCSPNRFFKGRCAQVDWEEVPIPSDAVVPAQYPSAPPLAFRYFDSDRYGGASAQVDYCPMIGPYASTYPQAIGAGDNRTTQQPRSATSRIDGGSNTFGRGFTSCLVRGKGRYADENNSAADLGDTAATDNVRGEEFGPASLCHEAVYESDPAKPFVGCYKTQCFDGEVYLRVGVVWKKCEAQAQTPAARDRVAVFGADGDAPACPGGVAGSGCALDGAVTVACPPPEEVCPPVGTDPTPYIEVFGFPDPVDATEDNRPCDDDDGPNLVVVPSEGLYVAVESTWRIGSSGNHIAITVDGHVTQRFTAQWPALSATSALMRKGYQLEGLPATEGYDDGCLTGPPWPANGGKGSQLCVELRDGYSRLRDADCRWVVIRHSNIVQRPISATYSGAASEIGGATPYASSFASRVNSSGGVNEYSPRGVTGEFDFPNSDNGYKVVDEFDLVAFQVDSQTMRQPRDIGGLVQGVLTGWSPRSGGGEPIRDVSGDVDEDAWLAGRFNPESWIVVQLNWCVAATELLVFESFSPGGVVRVESGSCDRPYGPGYPEASFGDCDAVGGVTWTRIYEGAPPKGPEWQSASARLSDATQITRYQLVSAGDNTAARSCHFRVVYSGEGFGWNITSAIALRGDPAEAPAAVADPVPVEAALGRGEITVVTVEFRLETGGTLVWRAEPCAYDHVSGVQDWVLNGYEGCAGANLVPAWAKLATTTGVAHGPETIRIDVEVDVGRMDLTALSAWARGGVGLVVALRNELVPTAGTLAVAEVVVVRKPGAVRGAPCLHGVVVRDGPTDAGRCQCFPGAYGPTCEFLQCPNDCLDPSNAGALPGICDRTTGRCQCLQGRYGVDCSGSLGSCTYSFDGSCPAGTLRGSFVINAEDDNNVNRAYGAVPASLRCDEDRAGRDGLNAFGCSARVELQMCCSPAAAPGCPFAAGPDAAPCDVATCPYRLGLEAAAAAADLGAAEASSAERDKVSAITALLQQDATGGWRKASCRAKVAAYCGQAPEDPACRAFGPAEAPAAACAVDLALAWCTSPAPDGGWGTAECDAFLSPPGCQFGAPRGEPGSGSPCASAKCRPDRVAAAALGLPEDEWRWTSPDCAAVVANYCESNRGDPACDYHGRGDGCPFLFGSGPCASPFCDAARGRGGRAGGGYDEAACAAVIRAHCAGPDGEGYLVDPECSYLGYWSAASVSYAARFPSLSPDRAAAPTPTGEAGTGGAATTTTAPARTTEAATGEATGGPTAPPTGLPKGWVAGETVYSAGASDGADGGADACTSAALAADGPPLHFPSAPPPSATVGAPNPSASIDVWWARRVQRGPWEADGTVVPAVAPAPGADDGSVRLDDARTFCLTLDALPNPFPAGGIAISCGLGADGFAVAGYEKACQVPGRPPLAASTETPPGGVVAFESGDVGADGRLSLTWRSDTTHLCGRLATPVRDCHRDVVISCLAPGRTAQIATGAATVQPSSLFSAGASASAPDAAPTPEPVVADPRLSTGQSLFCPWDLIEKQCRRNPSATGCARLAMLGRVALREPLPPLATAAALGGGLGGSPAEEAENAAARRAADAFAVRAEARRRDRIARHAVYLDLFGGADRDGDGTLTAHEATSVVAAARAYGLGGAPAFPAAGYLQWLAHTPARARASDPLVGPYAYCDANFPDDGRAPPVSLLHVALADVLGPAWVCGGAWAESGGTQPPTRRAGAEGGILPLSRFVAALERLHALYAAGQPAPAPSLARAAAGDGGRAFAGPAGSGVPAPPGTNETAAPTNSTRRDL